MNSLPPSSPRSASRDAIDQGTPLHTPLPERTLVLIGMMGAGKTTVGKRLAHRLKRTFVDSDAVIERAAGCSVSEFFSRHGENVFRTHEQKTITEVLSQPSCVLSVGGGAFMNAETRALMRTRAVTIWLKADIDMLLERALRHGTRPLLETDDPRGRMIEILQAREAIYAEADLVVESDNRPVDITATRVKEAYENYLKDHETR